MNTEHDHLQRGPQSGAGMGTTLHKQCGPLRRGRPRTAVTQMFGDGLAARHSWAFLPETQSASYTSSFLLHRMQCLLHKMIHLLRGVRLNEGQFQLPLCLDGFNHRLSEGKKIGEQCQQAGSDSLGNARLAPLCQQHPSVARAVPQALAPELC